MSEVIKPNKDIKSILGTTVGYIKVNKPWINHNASYECAAWWEDTEIQPGVYDLVIKQNTFAPYELKLVAKLDAIVVDDYFPAMFGGVAITKYTSKGIGEKRTISKSFTILESVSKTGVSPGSDIDICINPMIWEAIIDSAKETMLDFQSSMEHYWQDYKTEGDGTFDTNLSMIGYCANNIKHLTHAIMEIKRRKEYISGYLGDLYANNTSWIKVA